MDTELVDTAARIYCEHQLTDYRVAKLRAFEALGCRPGTPLPDNAAVQAAIIDYQRLFGGEPYRQHLQAMRRTAIEAMKLLVDFVPRLVGGAVSGAVTPQHRVQLHAFADPQEMVDLFLFDRGIPFVDGGRRYRDRNGRWIDIPLVQLEADRVGVDIAVFPLDGLRQAPISPLDNRPFRRLAREQVEALLSADAP